MSSKGAVAVRWRREYPTAVRNLLRFLLLVSVALLPLTSFAARAHTAADLTSCAVELEQGFLPNSSHQAPSPQSHHHCTLWLTRAGESRALTDNLQPGGSRGYQILPDASVRKSSGPQAPTPPPKL